MYNQDDTQVEDEVKQCMQSYLEVRVLGRIKYENALKEDKSRYYEA